MTALATIVFLAACALVGLAASLIDARITRRRILRRLEVRS